MTRAKTFDPDTVLRAAMHAFRRRGYERTSIKDLEQSTGLTCGSLYNAFGDKDRLFRAALSHYNVAIVHGRIEKYARVDAGISGLRQLFLTLLQEPDGGSSGCLLTNSAVEFGSDESIPGSGVHEGLHSLQEAFAAVLLRARREGKIPRGAPVATIALRLLAFYQGLLVLIRCGHDRAALADVIRAEFDQLEGKHP